MNGQFKNLMLNIVKNPRLAFNSVIDEKLSKTKFLLLSLLGISALFSNAISKNLGDNFDSTKLVLYLLVTGPIFGILWAYLISALISWTGKWIKGYAKTNQVLNVLSIAAIPLILILMVNALFVAIFGSGIFKSGFDIQEYSTLSILIYKIGNFVKTILLLYYLFLFVIGISTLQGFSIFKSILNILLALLTIVLPFVIIGFLMARLS